MARWLRVLLPAAALVVSAPDAARSQMVEDEDAVIVDADTLPSGPLSLASALAQAAGASAT